MNDMPLRVAVTGITGRMGQEIIRCIEQYSDQSVDKKIVLGAAIAQSCSKFCGMDIKSVIPSNISGIIITDSIKSVKENFDILIDFTAPIATMEYLKFCVMYHKNMIIGTTGLDNNHLSIIRDASKEIGIVYSANFSIGIAVLLKLLEYTTKSIGKFVDIDIIETHHNKKKDIPSGTAYMLYDCIKNNLSQIESLCSISNDISYNKTKSNMDFQYSSLSSKVIGRDISIHSIRSGNIAGEHTVLFSGSDECLEIKHRAFNRSIFANGALYAAVWLRNKISGLFSLNDVMGF